MLDSFIQRMASYLVTVRSLAAVVFVSALPFASSQIEILVDHKGEFRRIVELDRRSIHVENERGKRVRAEFEHMTFSLADDFGEGLVTVDFGEARDPRQMKRNTVKAGKSSFEMTVKLTSDRDMKNCFYLLLFTSNGSMATFYDSIGALKANKSRDIKIVMPAQVDAIGSLHIFERGREVRTNDSVAGRSLDEEYKLLLRGFTAVPNTVLFKPRRTYPHIVSPSGRFVVTYRDEKTHQRLLAFDAESMAIRCSVDIGKHDDAVSDPVWLDDDTVLFIFEDELQSLDVSSGELRKLCKPAHYISRVLPDEEHAIVFCRSFRGDQVEDFFVEVNCKTGERESRQSGSSFDRNYLDPDGKFCLKQEFAKTETVHRIRSSESSFWTSLDSLNNEPGVRFDYSTRDTVDYPEYVVGFGDDSKTLLVSSNRDRETYALMKYDLESGRFAGTVLQDDEFDIGGDDDTEINVLRKSDQRVIGVGYWRDTYVTKWFDERFGEAQRAVEEALPNLQHKAVSWDDEARSIVFYSFSGTNPGSYFLYNSGSSSLRKMYDMNPSLSSYKLGSVRSIRVKADDGVEVHCYVTLPPDWDGKPVPVIASIHGGPTVRDQLEYDPINQFYATRGFAVLEVNYRGSIGFGRKYKLDGILGNLDTTPIDDIAAAVKYLVAHGVAQPDRVAIIGGSWGGYSVYMSLVRHPELYRCGVAFAAPVDLGEMLGDDALIGNKVGYAFWQEILKERASDPGYIDRVSPINHVDEIAKPVLICQGEQDWRVSKGQATMMADALRKKGKEYALVLYPKDGHGHDDFGWNHYLNETEAFIMSQLGL